MSDIRFRMLVSHKKDCSALAMVRKGQWTSPWWMPARARWLASDGTAKGHSHRWHMLECNSTDCPAIAVVSEKSICEAIPHD